MCAKRVVGRQRQGWWDARAEDKEAGHLAGNLDFVPDALKHWNRKLRFLFLQLLIRQSVGCRDDPTQALRIDSCELSQRRVLGTGAPPSTNFCSP